MKKITLDDIGYYLSCMLFFNIIYILKILSDNCFGKADFLGAEKFFYWNFITFIIVILFGILGIVFTGKILCQDDSIKNINSLGKTVTITELEDLTGENYFANFSVLVLTSLSLPTSNHVCSLLAYLFIVLSLGIVYMKKQLIYMNPVLTFMSYSIYRCKDKESGDIYIFVIRDGTIKEGITIVFQNISRKIIRLQKVEHE